MGILQCVAATWLSHSLKKRVFSSPLNSLLVYLSTIGISPKEWSTKVRKKSLFVNTFTKIN